MPCDTLAPPIEVLLVDDQRAILAGVTALIDSEAPTMRVVGHATSGRQAVNLALNAQPDVIVLDIDLGGEDGLTLIPELRSRCGARIVIFTCGDNPDARRRALRLGAASVISKAGPGEDLITAICGASAG